MNCSNFCKASRQRYRQILRRNLMNESVMEIKWNSKNNQLNPKGREDDEERKKRGDK